MGIWHWIPVLSSWLVAPVYPIEGTVDRSFAALGWSLIGLGPCLSGSGCWWSCWVGVVSLGAALLAGLHCSRVILTFRWIPQHTASCPLAGVVGCSSIVRARFSRAGSRGIGVEENYLISCWGLVGDPLLMWRRLSIRRRTTSVADILQGIRQNGFSQGRWDALLGRWKAVCDQGPCGPLRSLEPWAHWVPPHLHGSTSGFSVDEFVRQVVTFRRDTGLQNWANGLREDLGSRPCAWLRPDFVPPSPFLVTKDF